MNVPRTLSGISSALSEAWSDFRYEAGFGPPPWRREELVDSIDFGDDMIADVRTYRGQGGEQRFLVEISRCPGFYTVAMLTCCELEAVTRLLRESEHVMKQFQTRQLLNEC